MENVFLDVDDENDVFGNRLEFVLPRMMYLLDNNNFQTALYFKPFCMMFWRRFWRERLFFWTGVFCRRLEYASATYANACGCG